MTIMRLITIKFFNRLTALIYTYIHTGAGYIDDIIRISSKS